ncbi:histidine kinase/DNA gyrase B/HSP90-like ATPase [Ureibacillus xyleni]|uniref:Oxygen sensor histidine kinase NreB n=1 Tax=Ureibacillus xyleni TaxID=614648 RepID=A0A285S3Y1_9BACL|nr:sensor histidine kinase [Ureibacillus xyleni]SOB99799.1 histidine kinase/DNA gyrase B/HSP90-like ATPase [Ureibacillus xyleni]
MSRQNEKKMEFEFQIHPVQNKKILQAQEEERKRISRELHDSVSQDLIGMLIDLRVLKNIDREELLHCKINKMEQSILTLIKQIKNICVELRTPVEIENNLEDSLQKFFNRINKQFGITIHFNSNISTNLFNSEINTGIYRICQEAIMNAVKYAKVEEIFVRFEVRNGFIKIEITDKGIGFRIQDKKEGLGLLGMKERAELINGKLNVQSRVGKGTVVQLLLPSLKEGAY